MEDLTQSYSYEDHHHLLMVRWTLDSRVVLPPSSKGREEELISYTEGNINIRVHIINRYILFSEHHKELDGGRESQVYTSQGMQYSSIPEQDRKDYS